MRHYIFPWDLQLSVQDDKCKSMLTKVIYKYEILQTFKVYYMNIIILFKKWETKIELLKRKFYFLVLNSECNIFSVSMA